MPARRTVARRAVVHEANAGHWRRLARVSAARGDGNVNRKTDVPAAQDWDPSQVADGGRAVGRAASGEQ